MTCDDPIDVEYDGGYFDKDEQGWVADPTRVMQRGDLLDVERSGHVTTFRLGRRYPHAGFVALEPLAPHAWWLLFDLVSRRLVGGRLPGTRMRTLPPGALALADPAVDATAALAPLLEACVAGARVVYPTSVVTAPPRAVVAAALAAGDARLDVPADPGPGVYLQVWRRDGAPAITGCSARTDTPAGRPYVAVGLRSSGEVDLHVGAESLEVIDAAFAALEVALPRG